MTTLADLRSEVKVIASTVATSAYDLDASRIFLGHKHIANTTDQRETMLSTGPQLVIHGGQLDSWVAQQGLGTASCFCDLFIAYRPENDYTWEEEEVFIQALVDAFSSTDSWSSGTPPTIISVDQPRFDHIRTGGVAVWRISMRGLRLC